MDDDRRAEPAVASTVKHHLANARSKVGVATTAQLVWILAPQLPDAEGTSSATSGALLDEGPVDAADQDAELPRASTPPTVTV